MRDYLENFLSDHGYEKDDSIYLLNCYDKIYADDEAREYLNKAVAYVSRT